MKMTPQLIIYCAYIVAFNANASLLYLYMLLTFEGFTPGVNFINIL